MPAPAPVPVPTATSTLYTPGAPPSTSHVSEVDDTVRTAQGASRLFASFSVTTTSAAEVPNPLPPTVSVVRSLNPPVVGDTEETAMAAAA